jgi:hypothetical protein
MAMSHRTQPSTSLWAVVIADDHGADSLLPHSCAGQSAPVQYSALNGNRTLFQEAVERAMRIAPASQVIVTALDAYRHYWEPALWFIRPEHRFISTSSGMSWLTTAAAILAIAYQAPDSVVALLPGRCFVSHEPVLSAAIDKAISLLPVVPESVISLGMQDLDCGVDEDYLVPRKGERAILQPLLGVARRPVAWIAQYLRAEGALVASRITCSYARTLASHICLVWPGLASRLLEQIHADSPQDAAGGVRVQLPGALSGAAMLRSRHWYPPALPQRALPVRACGWSGLRTARAVAQVRSFLIPALHELPGEALPASPSSRLPAAEWQPFLPARPANPRPFSS